MCGSLGSSGGTPTLAGLTTEMSPHMFACPWPHQVHWLKSPVEKSLDHEFATTAPGVGEDAGGVGEDTGGVDAGGDDAPGVDAGGVDVGVGTGPGSFGRVGLVCRVFPILILITRVIRE